MKDAVIADNEEAKTKAVSDRKLFKNESDSTIASLENQGKEQKEKLKQENSKVEADVKTFDSSVVQKNNSFKREFKHDMSEIGTALKDIFKDNVK